MSREQRIDKAVRRAIAVFGPSTVRNSYVDPYIYGCDVGAPVRLFVYGEFLRS